MSIKVMAQVWEQSSQQRGHLLVLLAIADFADDSGMAFPSVETLARKARLSERQIHYALRDLKNDGELSIEQNGGPHGCNLYRVQLLQGATIAGVQLATGGGAISDIKGVQPIAPKPSLDPSIEPSVLINSPDFPEWFKTLSQDPRWHGKNPERYIRSIESEYSTINLDLEAHSAYEWLQSDKGQKKKVLRGFWRNWLKNALEYSRSDNDGKFRAHPPADRQGETPIERAAREQRERFATAGYLPQMSRHGIRDPTG